MIEDCKHILILILFLTFVMVGKAESIEQPFFPSDTTIYREVETINVFPRKGIKMNPRQYARLVKKIRKVYPLAKEAAIEMQKYNEKYKGLKSEKKKRQYIKTIEKELFKKHEKELKHFTISEGRYLMLLIDRQTGDTSYGIIDELKGNFSAHFWQSIAKIFGNDLKERYDPIYKHFLVEQIVLQLERENP
jgi:hypothetical protein